MKKNYKPGLCSFLILFFALSYNSFSQDNPDVQKKVDLKNELNQGRLKTPGDTAWKNIEFGANLNQGSFSSNWTGGGVNSIALGLFFNALSEKNQVKMPGEMISSHNMVSSEIKDSKAEKTLTGYFLIPNITVI